MIARIHQLEHAAKCFKIRALLRLQRVLDEEWNDALQQVLLTAHPVGPPVAVIRSNHAAPEVVLQCLQQFHIAFVLHDGELRKNLKTTFQVGVSIDTNMKAAFTVHETCDPFRLEL